MAFPTSPTAGGSRTCHPADFLSTLSRADSSTFLHLLVSPGGISASSRPVFTGGTLANGGAASSSSGGGNGGSSSAGSGTSATGGVSSSGGVSRAGGASSSGASAATGGSHSSTGGSGVTTSESAKGCSCTLAGPHKGWRRVTWPMLLVLGATALVRRRHMVRYSSRTRFEQEKSNYEERHLRVQTR